jgi:hypothetical protein
MAGELQIFTSLDALVERTNSLIASRADYRSRAETAEAELLSLRETVREQQKHIRQLEKNRAPGPVIVDKSVSFSKIVSDKLADSADAAEIRQKLDEYIGHIDRCIAQLSNLS